MSNSLLEKITADAAAAAVAIESAAQEQLAKYEAETAVLLAALETEATEALQKEKQHLDTVAASKMRQQKNIALQSAKRSGVDAVFADAFKALVESESDSYVTFFSNAAKQELPSGAKGVAYAPANRVDESKKILKNAGVDASVEERGSISAGLILDTEDGVYDVTLDRIFSELRPKLEVQLLEKIA